MPTPLGQPSCEPLAAREPQGPLRVPEQSLRGIRVRLDVEPPLDPEGCSDAPELDPVHGRPQDVRGAARRRRTSGRRLLPVRGYEGPHAVGGLRALPDPIVDARQIQLELLLPAAGNRIEKAHVLEARAALALASVGHDDVIEGLVARPAPRQANGYHGRIALKSCGGLAKRPPKKERGFYATHESDATFSTTRDHPRKLRLSRG